MRQAASTGDAQTPGVIALNEIVVGALYGSDLGLASVRVLPEHATPVQISDANGPMLTALAERDGATVTIDGALNEAVWVQAAVGWHDLLERIAAGDSNKLIARAFDLSLHTVKRHVANILDKLALSSRGEAAAWHHANATLQR